MTTLQQTCRFIAAGFGSGWLPKAPGTWGSLAAMLPAWLLVEQFGSESLVVATILITVIGCLVSYQVLPELDSDDPGWIVVDEWAGVWLATLVVISLSGYTLWALVGSFLGFRLFDILKPFPIRQLEHIGPPWWSIMADDLMAGIMAGFVVVVVLAVAGV